MRFAAVREIGNFKKLWFSQQDQTETNLVCTEYSVIKRKLIVKYIIQLHYHNRSYEQPNHGWMLCCLE